MNDSLSLLSLIWHASLVVQLVMVVLLAASIACWALIFQKYQYLRRAKQQSRAFEDDFWTGTSLPDLHLAAKQNAKQTGAMEQIFLAGMQEVQKLRERRVADSALILDSASRAMRVALQRELDALEDGLPFLASVGSVSPYIGLFGTVWGIMRSFAAIAAEQNSSLAVVAPGIAEALFATAIGLFAAIPAVIAYNRYSHGLNRFEAKLNRFADGFHSTLSRELEAAQ